ncbi:hypothetical protein EPN27_02025 [Patescibacteria group bacterium]|nr:MAG: hypothetical protein EPN27_02025 [Patescibacteria group bacterium]
MNKNEQHSSKSGSFRARAMASTAQTSPGSSGFRHPGAVPSGDQVAGEKGVKKADLSMGMACTSHHFYG